MAVKYTEEQLNSVDKSFLIQLLLQQQGKRKIASTLTFLGGCFAATDI